MTGAASRRVLVVRAGALGDTLMATPLVRALYEERPGSEIDFLCSPGGAALLATNPYLARRLTLRHRNLPYFISLEKRWLVKELRARGYSLAVVLESAPRYRELIERAGIGEIRSFDTVPFEPHLHSIVNNLRAGGFTRDTPADARMDLPVTPEALAGGQRLVEDLPRPIIGIHAGYGPQSKKRGQAERLRGWKSENFAEVAAWLVERGCSIVLTGSEEDSGMCQVIAEQAGRRAPAGNIRNLAGKTNVMGLAGLIKSFEVMVSVDSGPAHIAAAVGVPLVVLWGPGILNQTRPIGTSAPVSVAQVAVPCAPCYGTEQMKNCRQNICMEYISPAEVVKRATLLLDLANDRRGHGSASSLPVLR